MKLRKNYRQNMDLLLRKNFSIFTLRENMNWNNNKKGALNLFDSSAKGMHNVDQKQELA